MALTILGAVAAAALPTAADYGRLPAFEDIAISPDGERLAVLLNTGDGGRGLLIRNIASGDENLIDVSALKEIGRASCRERV